MNFREKTSVQNGEDTNMFGKEKEKNEKICPKCGAKAPSDARFCNKCGESFEKESSVDTAKAVDSSDAINQSTDQKDEKKNSAKKGEKKWWFSIPVIFICAFLGVVSWPLEILAIILLVIRFRKLKGVPKTHNGITTAVLVFFVLCALAGVSGSEEESLPQDPVAASKAAAEAASKEAAEKESKEAASKEAAEKESKEAASKEAAEKESREAASRAAEEESRKAQEEQEAQLQEAVSAIGTYMNDSSNKNLKKVKKLDPDVFDKAWKQSLGTVLEGENSWSIPINGKIDDYCELYQEAHPETISGEAQNVITSINTLKQIDSKISQLQNQYSGWDLDMNSVLSGNFYITQRLETSYDDTLAGAIRKEIDGLKDTGKTKWVGYDIEYPYGSPLPTGDGYVFETNNAKAFSSAGEYYITYVDTGAKSTLVNDQGFQRDVPVYKILPDYAQLEADSSQMLDLERQRSKEYADIRREILKNTGKELTAEEIRQQFEGNWWDLNSQRCNLTISVADNDRLNIEINWSSDAWTTTIWTMSGQYNAATGTVEYSDCVEKNDIYDDAGNVTSEVVYTGGTGRFYLEEGYLYWQDDMENQGSQCYFSR